MSLQKRIIFSFLACALVLSILEVSLYVSGFQYSQFPKFARQKKVDWWVENSWNTFEFVPHPVRMWALKPGVSTTNEYGYQGQPVPVERVPGYKKILFLGDSCTNAWEDHYPALTIIKLKDRYNVKVAPIIAGTPGYTTYQGLKWLSEFLDHKPDVLVVYYGWNDHWFGYAGKPDNEYVPISRASMLTKELFGNLKIYQALHRIIFPPATDQWDLDSKTYKEAVESYLRNTRVPPEYFAQNIEGMIKIAKDNGIDLYFVEAPHGKDKKAIDRHNWNLAGPLFKSDVSTLHKSYSFLLRETVAKHEGVHIVSFEDVEFDRTMMMEDGVHPLEKGYDLIAERLVEKMRDSSVALFSGPTRVTVASNLTSQN